jgi:AraC-like DNA-binding protein
MVATGILPPDNTGLANLGPAYREFAPLPHLNGVLDCVWMREHRGPDAHSRVVPDARIDIIWMGTGDLLVAGPATRPIISELPTGSSIAGIRFRPGIAPAVLGVPADALLDIHLPLEAIWSNGARELLERGDGLANGFTKLRLLQEVLTTRLDQAYEPDALVTAAVGLMHRNTSLSIGDLGYRLGLSERHLLRRFNASVGYGPKTLARILRFQSTISLLSDLRTTYSLASVAQLASYTDQAHMTREFAQLAGITPARVITTLRRP